MGIFPNDNLYKVNWLESWRLPNRREIGRNDIGRRRKKYIFLFNNDGFQLRKLNRMKNINRKNKRTTMVVRFERELIISSGITIVAVVDGIMVVQKLSK